ncbi:hypothetical protein O181_066845 [Austropuccinia psidii MF-1]|uniref:Uncharacterized protein n=1 Tax=Austropuccinia psidii MF-1 TaxID=1389203 RepID=A0A9Q3EPQ4_9BASI|nr:hypothetical protein [Austropuccinia psidii MF-1]
MSLYTSGILESKGTSHRTGKDCSEPKYQGLDTMDTILDGRTVREIIPTLPFTLKSEDWKDMDQVCQLHQLLKDLFQWTMDNKRLNLASHWSELGASCLKIFLKNIPFKYFMVITKGCNPNKQFKLLEERAARKRENQIAIQVIKQQLNQTEPTLIPSGSQ